MDAQAKEETAGIGIKVPYHLMPALIVFISIVLFTVICTYIPRKSPVIPRKEYRRMMDFSDIDDQKLIERLTIIVQNEVTDFAERLSVLPSSNNYFFSMERRTEKTQNLYSVYMSFSWSYDGEHVERSDRTCHYDISTQKEVLWADLFNDREYAVKKLFKISRRFLRDKAKQDENLKFALGKSAECESSFRHILFSGENKNITIRFIPEEFLAENEELPEDSFDIDIDIGFEYLNDILKEEYKVAVNGSTEAVELEPVREIRELDEYEDKKILVLTFDDGPSRVITERLLEALRERDVRVTFFVLGSRVKSYPDIVLAAYMDGHTIASHTYAHKNLRRLSESDARSEMMRTSEEIKSAIGIKPEYVRPPYGSYSSKITDLTDETFILWNVDTNDWKNRNAEMVSRHIISHAKDGAIILCHDLYETTVDGAIKAIDELIGQGYVFVSLEEAEQLGRISTDGSVYYNLLTK